MNTNLEEGAKIVSYDVIHAIIKYIKAQSVEITKGKFIKPKCFRLFGIGFSYSRYTPYLTVTFDKCCDSYLSHCDVKNNCTLYNYHIDAICEDEDTAKKLIIEHVLDYFMSSPDYIVKISKKHKNLHKIYANKNKYKTSKIKKMFHAIGF